MKHSFFACFRRVYRTDIFSCKHHAFSLIEMLMALLVASLLMVAMAPVITKKFDEKVNVSGTGKGNNRAPANFQCFSYAPGNESVTYKIDDAYSVNFLIASGGGGGAGATEEYVLDNQSYFIGSTSTAAASLSTLKITEDMDEINIDFMTGGGGGGGGGSTIKSGSTPSAASCASAGSGKTDTVGNSNFATYESANGLCVTKFNQAPQSYTPAPGNTSTNYAAGTLVCASGYSHTCDSNTNAYASNGPAYTYSGCGRTVCNHPAAESACTYLANKTGNPWRLPTIDEIAKWNSQQRWRDLHLCDSSASSYVSRCTASSSYLYQYAGNSFLGYPYDVWSSTADGSNFKYYALYGSWGGPGSNNPGYLFSVRCVLGATETFYSLSAAGGGGAPALVNGNAINSTLNEKVKENIGGTIEITAGGGGAGGGAASGSGKKASDGLQGGTSCVTVKDKNNFVKYRVCTIGGYGGGGADGTSGTQGAGGTAHAEVALNAGGCYTQTADDGAKTTIACSSVGHAGTNGLSSSNNPSGGGVGGVSNYPGASTSGATYISNITGATLDDGTNPGAGGGGGRAISTSGSPGYSLGAGGRGTGGYVRLKYKRKFPGAGGGGGASGSVVKIPGVYVGKSANCTFVLGKGGAGGAVGSAGTGGGTSSITCDNSSSTSYSVPGGGGGAVGSSSQTSGGTSTGGTGGTAFEPGKLDEIISVKKGSFYSGTAGDDAVESIGGNGGKSGTGSAGGFGGFNDATNQNIGGAGFIYSDIITPLSSEVVAGTYGSAGAGGGGGSWVRDLGAGKGGNGLGGYVCVYWDNENSE